MTAIETIRSEIERIRSEAVMASFGNDSDWLRSRVATCVDILAFLDTLPEGLEEAADTHIRKARDTPGWDWTTQDIADAFKAGAEWMAGQGYTQKCRIKADYDPHGADYGIRYLYVRMPDDSPIGEEVIVQIRKK